MKYLNLLFYFTILSLMMFAGCDLKNAGEDSLTIEELRAELIDKNWELRTVEIDGFGTFVPPDDTMYTLRFFEDGNFTGKDRCNTCGGTYEIDELKNIHFSEFLCTEIACRDTLHKIDFSTVLNEGKHPFYFENDRLYITVNKDKDEPENFKFAEPTSGKEVIMADVMNFNRSDWPNSPHHQLDAEINGDSLWAHIGFNGCGPHDLNMVFYNYFIESKPVQAYAVIAHKGDELCGAAFQSEETFDLTPLKEAFQQSYGEEGIIDISIRQSDTTLKKLRYSF